MSDPLAGLPPGLLDPDEWFKRQEERLATLREHSDRAKGELAAARVERTDRDHVVTVAVNTSGALLSASFSPRAQGMSPAQLSTKLMQTYGEAVRDAAKQMLGIMSGLIGEDSDSMAFLKSTLPDLDGEDDADGYGDRDSSGYRGRYDGGYGR